MGVIVAGADGAGRWLSVGWVCVGLSERLRRAVCGCRVSDQPRWYWAYVKPEEVRANARRKKGKKYSACVLLFV